MPLPIYTSTMRHTRCKRYEMPVRTYWSSTISTTGTSHLLGLKGGERSWNTYSGLNSAGCNFEKDVQATDRPVDPYAILSVEIFNQPVETNEPPRYA